MSVTYAILCSLGICVGAAALEGACAGPNVRKFFFQVRMPPDSPPLWVWIIIGAL